MPGPNLPEIPVPLKSIQPYIKIANEHDQRDPVVSYWCRLYALQTGLKFSTKATEETNFLLKLMDWLESTKKAHLDNEAITNDIAAQAHLENYSLKLFLYADKNDRASNFGKNIVQSFYTAGLLYDVLTTFGELSEEAQQNRKYAKWKAAYIHNCLKNGQTPVPGPLKDDDDNSNENVGSDIAEIEIEDNQDDENIGSIENIENKENKENIENNENNENSENNENNENNEHSENNENNENSENNENNENNVHSENNENNENSENNENNENNKNNENNGNSENNENNENSENNEESDQGVPSQSMMPMMPTISTQPTPPTNMGPFNFPSVPDDNERNEDDENKEEIEPHPYNPAPTPTNPGTSNKSSYEDRTSVLTSEAGAELTVEQSAKAQKYIKWAGSALNYDDVPTAITNLRKALHLLSTGEDPV